SSRRSDDPRSILTGCGRPRESVGPHAGASSGAFGPGALAPATEWAQLDAAEPLGPEVDPSGLTDLGGCDGRDPIGPVARLGHAAADRIDEAQLVARDPAQAVAEAGPTAEDVVEDDQGVVVGMVAGDAQMAQDDVDLVAGLVDAPDARSSGPGHGRDRWQGPA